MLVKDITREDIITSMTVHTVGLDTLLFTLAGNERMTSIVLCTEPCRLLYAHVGIMYTS